MTDTKAPILKRFVLPASIDIGKGSQAFRIDVEGDDGQDGSGIRYVSIWLDRELDYVGGNSQLLQFGYTFLPDGFGDDTPNSAFASYTVGPQTPVGTYTVTGVWLTDQAGNVAKYDTPQLKALGMNTTLSVTGRPLDVTPPVLKSLTLPASVDVSAGSASLPVQVEASDNAGGEGVRMVTIWLDHPIIADGYRNYALSVGNNLGGDDFRDGTPQQASRTLMLDAATTPGTYTVNRVTVEDRAGNVREVHFDELKAMGASTSITVTGGVADATPPQLLDLWLPRTVSVKPGAQNGLAVSVRDPAGGKGVSSVIAFFDRVLAFSNGASDALSANKYSNRDTLVDATPGFAVTGFKLTDATTPGTYNLREILVSDFAGNHSTYTTQQLQALGINTAMTVVDKPSTATTTPLALDGQVRVALSSADWAAAGTDAFTVTLAYDAAKLGLVGAAVLGAPAIKVTTSVTQPGRVTVSGSGELAAGAVLELVLQPLGGTQAFQYAIESFRVNGMGQVFGTGNMENVRFGTAGADVLQETAATGLLDGMGGVDEAVFEGLRADYTVRRSGSGFVVSHDGGERVALSGIERLRFGDEKIALDIDGAGGQVYRLYQAAFDRRPEGAGVGFWMKQMDGGASLASVARSFLTSGEFESKYGVEPGNEAYLNALYTNVLHRAADPAGYAYWLQALRSNFDRAELLVLFSESAENVAQVIGSIENGFSYV